jgi:hypothetical protein
MHKRRTRNTKSRNISKETQKKFFKWQIPAIAATVEELLPPPIDSKHNLPLDEKFAAIHVAVNAAESLLDIIPKKDFGKLMGHLDLYAGLKRLVVKEYGMTISTNAALKMYELIIQMRLFRCDTGAVQTAKVFCNAELPGAFINAINHYIKTMCPQTSLDWVASSYYPDVAHASGDVTILGDRYGIYAGNREKWLMGPKPNAMPENEPPSTGDLTDSAVVAAIADGVHSKFNTGSSGATLYTSDAGIDVSGDYGRQEEITSLLNYGQVLCGVLALAPGGHLVTKQFTFTSQFNRSLIALLAALFDEVFITKPLTSRPANSEIYLVARGFKGIDGKLANALLDRLHEYGKGAKLPSNFAPLIDPKLYVDAEAVMLRAATAIHARQQVLFLNEASRMYKQYSTRLNQLGSALRTAAHIQQDRWLADNPVCKIKNIYQLVTAIGNERNSRAQITVRIVSKYMSSGLGVDAEVIKNVYPFATIVHASKASKKEKQKIVDVQFHLEHYVSQHGDFPARKHYILVNQEFLFDWDVSAIISGAVTALCKTALARNVLSDLGVVHPHLVKFTTPGFATGTPGVEKNQNLIIHIAGTNGRKGTLEVLRSWFELGGDELGVDLVITRQIAEFAKSDSALDYWDSLGTKSIVTYMGISDLEQYKNVYLAKHRIPASDVEMLVNTASIHLCPSIIEGWGHSINAGRAAGAVVITTDAAPMNELVSNLDGFVVSTDSKMSTTLGELNPTQHKYLPKAVSATVVEPVMIGELMIAVKSALKLNAAERAALGNAAKARYNTDTAYFERALQSVVVVKPAV